MNANTQPSPQQRDSNTSMRRKLLDIQTRRREQVLERQRSNRQTKLDRARRAALQTLLEGGTPPTQDTQEQQPVQHGHDVATHPATRAGHTSRRPPSGVASVFAQQFMQPEWLLEVPVDLGTNWYVCPRPEGQRCLVVASHGCTVIRGKTGTILNRCESGLPGGSTATPAGGAYTIVDAILQHPHDPITCTTTPNTLNHQHHRHQHQHASTNANNTTATTTTTAASVLWIVDVLCWRGVDLTECTAEMRLYWVKSRMQEEQDVLNSGLRDSGYSSGGRGPVLSLVEYYEADVAGLTAAYSTPTPYTKDGLLLLHKYGVYQGGCTPTALLWKDGGCSRFAVDTNADGSIPDAQRVVLEYRMDGTVATCDDPPCVLGSIPPSARAALTSLRAGVLLRFGIGPHGIQFDHGQPIGADLALLGVAGRQRGKADALSKILFQYFMRRDPVTFEHLLHAAAGEGDDGDGDGDGDGGGGCGMTDD